MLIDKIGRKINYLRVSITDRCNLRCVYCSQKDSFSWLPPDEILSYEELYEVIRIFVSLGIERVRLTGGEPLVRKGLCSFIAKISKIPGLKDISLTTNGVLLKEKAWSLKKAGLQRINISLDTLEEKKFAQITGRPYLSKVLKAIETALKVGFNPIKINMVVMKGINDQEILSMALWTKRVPLHVRFIEFMPVGEGVSWGQEKFLSIEEIKKRLKPLGKFFPIKNQGAGPAETYTFPGALGTIGFIGAMSNHFCKECNRLRLTPEGHIRPCLFSDLEFDLKKVLRRPHTEKEIQEIIRKAILAKPVNRLQEKGPKRLMRSIGG